MTLQTPVILDACRLPTGKFQGSLSGFSAPQLGGHVISALLKRTGVPADAVGECIMGCVLQAGLGQNPARQAALKGGLPASIGALTINKVCGSSLKAAVLAAQAVTLGDHDAVIAGGMESMSNAPYLLTGARDGYRLGNGELVDVMIRDGLWEAYEDYHMGCTAELVCREYGVSREEQDAYALESHKRAVEAWDKGLFRDEVVPIEIPQRKGDPLLFERDEGPRGDSSLEALAKLRPVFQKDGSVTAGNASTINDGASAVLVTSEAMAERHGSKPLARIVAWATSGLEPKMVMMTPQPAIEKVLEKAGWSLDEVDLIEINEAFAAQQVALRKVMGLDPARHNARGGGVSLGHPIGASGARILTSLTHAMKQEGKKRGVAALCMGGGNGVAVAVEAI